MVQTIRIDLTEWKGKLFSNKMQEALRKGIGDAASLVETHAKEKISRPNPTGKNPSLPGEPPKTVTGNLRSSLYSRVVDSAKTVRGQVIADAYYSAFLEFGTIKMAPRPFMRPSLAEKKAEILAAVYDSLQRG